MKLSILPSTRSVTLVLAGVLASSTLGACAPGSGSADGSARKAPALETDSEIRALLPDDIREQGYIDLAADPTYPPSTFMEGQTMVGLEPDVWNAVGDLMGVEMRPVAVAFDSIVPGLQAGRYDASFAGFWITDERTKVVDMVEFFRSGSQFVVTADSDLTIDSLDDVCGLTVALQSGSYEVPYAQEQDKKCEDAGEKGVEVQVYKTQDQATLAVSTGRADATGMGAEVAGYLAEESKGKLRTAGDIFHEVSGGLALPKDSDLSEAVIAALEELKKNGTYDEIFADWGLEAAEADTVRLVTSESK